MVPLSANWTDTRVENSAIEIGALFAPSTLKFPPIPTFRVGVNGVAADELDGAMGSPSVFGARTTFRSGTIAILVPVFIEYERYCADPDLPATRYERKHLSVEPEPEPCRDAKG
jgi:hypothetical protein